MFWGITKIISNDDLCLRINMLKNICFRGLGLLDLLFRSRRYFSSKIVAILYDFVPSNTEFGSLSKFNAAHFAHRCVLAILSKYDKNINPF